MLTSQGGKKTNQIFGDEYLTVEERQELYKTLAASSPLSGEGEAPLATTTTTTTTTTSSAPEVPVGNLRLAERLPSDLVEVSEDENENVISPRHLPQWVNDDRGPKPGTSAATTSTTSTTSTAIIIAPLANKSALISTDSEKKWFNRMVGVIGEAACKPLESEDKKRLLSALVRSAIANRWENTTLVQLESAGFDASSIREIERYRTQIIDHQQSLLATEAGRSSFEDFKGLCKKLNDVIELKKRECIQTWLAYLSGRRAPYFLNGELVKVDKDVIDRCRGEAERLSSTSAEDRDACPRFLNSITDVGLRALLAQHLDGLNASFFEITAKEVATVEGICALYKARIELYKTRGAFLLERETHWNKAVNAQEKCRNEIVVLRRRVLQELKQLQDSSEENPTKHRLPGYFEGTAEEVNAILKRIHLPQDCQDTRGNTLLHYLLCKDYRDESLAVFLIKAGESCEIVNENGQTPLGMLLDEQRQKFMELVEKGERAKSKTQLTVEARVAEYKKTRAAREASWLRKHWLSGDERVAEARAKELAEADILFRTVPQEVTDEKLVEFLYRIAIANRITNKKGTSGILDELKKIYYEMVFLGGENNNVELVRPGQPQPSLVIVPVEDEESYQQMVAREQRSKQKRERLAREVAERDAVIQQHEAVIQQQRVENEAKDAVIQEHKAVIQEHKAVIQEHKAVIQDRDAVIQAATAANAQLTAAAAATQAEIRALREAQEEKNNQMMALLEAVVKKSGWNVAELVANQSNPGVQGAEVAPVAVATASTVSASEATPPARPGLSFFS